MWSISQPQTYGPFLGGPCSCFKDDGEGNDNGGDDDNDLNLYIPVLYEHSIYLHWQILNWNQLECQVTLQLIVTLLKLIHNNIQSDYWTFCNDQTQGK